MTKEQIEEALEKSSILLPAAQILSEMTRVEIEKLPGYVVKLMTEDRFQCSSDWMYKLLWLMYNEANNLLIIEQQQDAEDADAASGMETIEFVGKKLSVWFDCESIRICYEINEHLHIDVVSNHFQSGKKSDDINF